MTRFRALLVVMATVMTISSGSVFAWTNPTRMRMLGDALKVAPPGLAAILKKHRAELERGMTDPSRHEDEEVHFLRADGGGLAADAAVLKKKQASDLLSKKGTLPRFAYECGALAHLVADVSFPLNASDSDPREPLVREGYRKLIERLLDKIPFVLDPAPAPLIDSADLRPYLLESARRAVRSYARIAPAFKDDGTPVSPQAVDERSVPFGVGALAYSQAVNDIARIWALLWREAGGDMTGATRLTAGAVPAPPPSAPGATEKP
ncbi:MAG TPA: hypothetical protein VFQ07_00875 [Candidatus Polarisedimenticolia bacterium]|nr:hypothetical protein [Candidatus Polarisedimenticolia bacterium]